MPQLPAQLLYRVQMSHTMHTDSLQLVFLSPPNWFVFEEVDFLLVLGAAQYTNTFLISYQLVFRCAES